LAKPPAATVVRHSGAICDFGDVRPRLTDVEVPTLVRGAASGQGRPHRLLAARTANMGERSYGEVWWN
jgi:hypothetical protein